MGFGTSRDSVKIVLKGVLVCHHHSQMGGIMVTDSEIVEWLKAHPKSIVRCESVGFTLKASALANGFVPSLYTICGVPLESIVEVSKNRNKVPKERLRYE